MGETESKLEQAICKLADYKMMAKKEIDFYSKAIEIDESHIDMLISRMVHFKESISNVKNEIQSLKKEEKSIKLK